MCLKFGLMDSDGFWYVVRAGNSSVLLNVEANSEGCDILKVNLHRSLSNSDNP